MAFKAPFILLYHPGPIKHTCAPEYIYVRVTVIQNRRMELWAQIDDFAFVIVDSSPPPGDRSSLGRWNEDWRFYFS